jgi:Carboxypeptidase regulatory-like domain
MASLSRLLLIMTVVQLAGAAGARRVVGQLGAPTVRYELRGRLTDVHTGRPVVNALVWALDIGDSTHSDSAGAFVLRGRAAPRCSRFVVRAATYARVTAWFDLRHDSTVDAGLLRLERAQQWLTGVYYESPCGDSGDWPYAYGAVRGRIATPTGLGRPDEVVEVGCASMDPDTARTDGAGYYRVDLTVSYSQRRIFGDATSLLCRVVVRGAPDTALTRVRFAGSPLKLSPALVSFGRARLRAPYAVEASGTVLDGTDSTPVAGALVEVPDLNARTTVRENGDFDLRFQAPAGCFRLSVRYIGYAPVLRHLLIAQSGRVALGVFHLIRNPTGMAMDTLSGPGACAFTLRAWPWHHPFAYGAVVGRVTWSDGAPVRYAGLRLECGQSSRVEVDANGYYRIGVSFAYAFEDSMEGRRQATCRLSGLTTRDTLVTIPLAPTPLTPRPAVWSFVHPGRSPAER